MSSGVSTVVLKLSHALGFSTCTSLDPEMLFPRVPMLLVVSPMFPRCSDGFL